MIVLRVLLLTELSLGTIDRYVEKAKLSGDDSADSTQRTQRTPNLERPRNPENDHQTRTCNDDRNPGISSNRRVPVDDPSSSFNPLSTSSSAHAAVAVLGLPSHNYDHKDGSSPELSFRTRTVVDNNSLDTQVRVNHWILRHWHDLLIGMWRRTTPVRTSSSSMKPRANIKRM